jgi:hypothetical protein
VYAFSLRISTNNPLRVFLIQWLTHHCRNYASLMPRCQTALLADT